MSMLSRSRLTDLASVFPILLTVAVVLLSVDSQSLWTDELGTWRLTIAPTWREWAIQLLTWYDSDTQIPLYHLYMKIWVSAAGTSEYMLRMSNAPWALLAVLAFLFGPSSPSTSNLFRGVAVVVLCHPLTWYYLNEARPYLMLLAGASIASSGLMSLMLVTGSPAAEHRATSFVIVGSALMAVTSVLGVIWTAAYVGPAAFILYRSHGWTLGLTRYHAALTATLAVLAAPVFFHYGASFLEGKSAATLGHTIGNFLFAFYETSGVSGLGPGRFDLRSFGAAALRGYSWLLLSAAVPIVLVVIIGVRSWWRQDRAMFLAMLAGFAIPLAALYLLGVVRDWRVVGRHVIPLVLLFSILTARGCMDLWKCSASRPTQFLSRALCLAFLVVLVASALLLTHASRHQRDDFKAAAALAREQLALGRNVWWGANKLAADYYGVPLEFQGCSKGNAGAAQSAVFLYRSVDARTLEACPRPDLVIAALRDVVQVNGAGQSQDIQSYLRTWEFERRTSWIGVEAWYHDDPSPESASNPRR